MSLSYKELKSQTPQLDPLTRITTMRGIGFEPPKDEEERLPPGVVLCVLISDMLTRVQVTGSVQCTLMLQTFRSRFFEWADHLDGLFESAESNTIKNVPIYHLGFVERKYATISGHTGLLDLHTGETVDGLSHAPLETISYDCATLYLRCTVGARHDLDEQPPPS